MNKYPAIVLLIFVYCSLPFILSYQNAWMHPEQLRIKPIILRTGPDLNIRDIKNGLDWRSFEFAPRATRPLSSYFEILDTKFRCWLWHFILPHPSLSLTWIFSLALAPLFLYQLLKNLGLSVNTALTMTAFYLLTPAALSNVVMLHRPGKPMANFTIIFCLYLASRLKIEFIDRKRPVPLSKYLILWAVAALSFYWDETVWLILPAMFFIFPEVLLKRKSYLCLWCLLPLLTLIGYFNIIPAFCSWAGHGYPRIEQYDKIASLSKMNIVHDSINNLLINTKSLVLDTMGIIPFSSQAPVITKAAMAAALISWWGMIMFFLFRARPKWDNLIIFLIGLILFSDYSMAITEKTWGPYYYGGYWSIFFTIYLGRQIEKAMVPKTILALAFFLISLNLINVFLDMNAICKKCQYYLPVAVAKDYFQEKQAGFGPDNAPNFSGEQIKFYTHDYWSRKDVPGAVFIFPKELLWLPEEVRPALRFHLKATEPDYLEVYQ